MINLSNLYTMGIFMQQPSTNHRLKGEFHIMSIELLTTLPLKTSQKSSQCSPTAAQDTNHIIFCHHFTLYIFLCSHSTKDLSFQKKKTTNFGVGPRGSSPQSQARNGKVGLQGCRFGPESSRQSLVSPIFRSLGTIRGG